VLQVLARAGSVEGVAVSTVTLRGWGTGNETGVGEVRLYRDGNEDGRWDAGDTLLGSWGTYGADEGTVTFAGLTEYVAAQTQASWVVVYDFGTGAPEGTYGAKVEKGTDVWGVGSVSGGGVTVWGAPVSGEAVSVEKASGSAGDYAAFAGGCVPGAGGAPLWPLLPLAAALWALARRKRRE